MDQICTCAITRVAPSRRPSDVFSPDSALSFSSVEHFTIIFTSDFYFILSRRVFWHYFFAFIGRDSPRVAGNGD